MSEQQRLDDPLVPAGDWFEQGPRPGTGEHRSVRAGWLAFASVLMVMTGALNATKGLAGVLADEFYVVPPANVMALDFTAWGWVHIAVGGLVALTGGVLLAGVPWARPAAIVLIVLNAIAQIAWVAVYPVWSAVVIALCVVVIWAIVVHGDAVAGES